MMKATMPEIPIPSSVKIEKLCAALHAAMTYQQQSDAMFEAQSFLKKFLPRDKWSALYGLSYGALCAVVLGLAGTNAYIAFPAVIAASLVSTRVANDPRVRVMCCGVGEKVGTGAGRAYYWICGCFGKSPE